MPDILPCVMVNLKRKVDGSELYDLYTLWGFRRSTYDQPLSADASEDVGTAPIFPHHYQKIVTYVLIRGAVV